MNVAESIDRCLEYVYSLRSVHTAKTYRNALGKFSTFLTEEGIPPPYPIGSVTIEHFIRFPAWLLRSGFTKKTACVYVSGAKFYLDWLVLESVLNPQYEQMLRYDKAVHALQKRGEVRLPRSPEAGDTEKIISAVRQIQRKSPIKERNIALVLFLESSGVRAEESTLIKVGDLDLEHRKGKIIGKGNKQRVIRFSTEAAEAIRLYYKERKFGAASHPVFARHDHRVGKKAMPISTNTVRGIVDEAMTLAGVEKGRFSPHRFRHHFAEQLLEATHNLALVQDALGHSSANTTRRYTTISEKALDEAHGKIWK